MGAKQIIFAEEARRKLKAGIDVVATAVATTLSPSPFAPRKCSRTTVKRSTNDVAAASSAQAVSEASRNRGASRWNRSTS